MPPPSLLSTLLLKRSLVRAVVMGVEIVKCKLCDVRLDAEEMMRHIEEHGYRYTTLEDWMD